jgi:hypothetical protein
VLLLLLLLHCTVRLLREELQLLQEPGSYVGEVIKVRWVEAVGCWLRVEPWGRTLALQVLLVWVGLLVWWCGVSAMQVRSLHAAHTAGAPQLLCTRSSTHRTESWHGLGVCVATHHPPHTSSTPNTHNLHTPFHLIPSQLKVMGKSKVLVKVHPEGKYVVDVDKEIDIADLTPGD